jgi:hypothetical protein
LTNTSSLKITAAYSPGSSLALPLVLDFLKSYLLAKLKNIAQRYFLAFGKALFS